MHSDPFSLHSLREHCGVFGVFNLSDAARYVVLGLHALQHRGHDAVGIVSSDGERFFSERHTGRVGDSFTHPDTAGTLIGTQAVGHVRYSTIGGTAAANIQPLSAELATGPVALAHNGQLSNARHLRRTLIRDGAIFQGTADTEIIMHLVARAPYPTLEQRLSHALAQLEGAFSLVCLTQNAMIGARDPVGIRPLVIGRLRGGTILASETCALDIIGASYVRDVKNGEIVVFTRDGERSHRSGPARPERLCIFEYIYFSRPDSTLANRNVYTIRKLSGEELAREHPAPTGDVVVPIPDSGVPAAIGYARASALPLEMGIVRNHYVGRTFIEPHQSIRSMGVRLKHNINRDVINGKSVVLVDDSLVRGTTAEKIVAMVRECGAREIHLRVASPEVRFPDFYGIDIESADRLIAAHRPRAEICALIGADSLAFLSLPGLYRALGAGVRDPQYPQFADHCFTGDYPTPIPRDDPPDRAAVAAPHAPLRTPTEVSS